MNTTKWLYCFVLSLMGIATISSCKKYNDTELNKGNTPLTLAADKTAIVLQESNAAANAITFNWTTGSNKGTNAQISYTLKIDKQGNNFNNAQVESLGTGVQTKTYTVKALNDLLISKWSATANVETILEAKVVIAVAGHAELADSTTIIPVKITPYKPVTTTLYLIGDATPNGWNAGTATAMTLSASIAGRFTWSGQLVPGNFKFITTLGAFLPSYNKGTDSTKLTYRFDNSQADNQFHIYTSGVYAISVNLLDSSITYTRQAGPPYSRLWIVGDATPNGWNINAPNEMRVDSSNLFVFTYNEVLNAGEFKIPVATGNWGGDFYMPLSNHPAITATGVQLVPGGNPDYKWQITTTGAYKIKLDLQTLSISIKPFTPYPQLWMVGDATPAGWNINTPTVMTPVSGNPYQFTYTGPMNAGEFKFPVATGNWGTDFFMPVLDQSGIGSTQAKFVTGGNPDYKWRLTQAGNYRITIDQLRETISIIKL